MNIRSSAPGPLAAALPRPCGLTGARERGDGLGAAVEHRRRPQQRLHRPRVRLQNVARGQRHAEESAQGGGRVAGPGVCGGGGERGGAGQRGDSGGRGAGEAGGAGGGGGTRAA